MLFLLSRQVVQLDMPPRVDTAITLKMEDIGSTSFHEGKSPRDQETRAVHALSHLVGKLWLKVHQLQQVQLAQLHRLSTLSEKN